MNTEVGRRMFVGSIVTGLPFMAGGGVSLAQSPPDHAHAADGGDPVLDLLVRQIAGVYNAAQKEVRAEHFRALAAQLRTIALYQRQLGSDDQVRAVLRNTVERQGRNALLYAESDEMRRQTLLAYGFRLDGLNSRRQILATHEARDAALTKLLTEGLVPTFDRLAATADQIAVRIDRPRARPVAFAPQDPDQEWWVGFCTELFSQYEQAQLIAAPVCAVAQYFSYFVPSCAALNGGAMVLLLAYLIECQMY